MPKPTPCKLYRHFDSAGNLLYVGISLSAVARLRQHNRTAHWSEKIASMTVETWPDTETAKLAEAEAIIRERPIYNKIRPLPRSFTVWPPKGWTWKFPRPTKKTPTLVYVFYEDPKLFSVAFPRDKEPDPLQPFIFRDEMRSKHFPARIEDLKAEADKWYREVWDNSLEGMRLDFIKNRHRAA